MKLSTDKGKIILNSHISDKRLSKKFNFNKSIQYISLLQNNFDNVINESMAENNYEENTGRPKIITWTPNSLVWNHRNTSILG